MQSSVVVKIFSGTKTVSQFFESKGFDIISIDNNPKLSPSICCDFLNFDFNLLPGSVAFFWLSPPCTHFSRSASNIHFSKKTVKYRIYEYTPLTPEALISVQLLSRCVDLLNNFPNVPFVIENPIGRIQHMPAIKNLPHYRYYVNYKDFGFDYSKETYLFTNFLLPFSTKKITYPGKGLRSVNSRLQRSSVPSDLIKFIYSYIPFK